MDDIHELLLISFNSFTYKLQSIINRNLRYEINFIFLSILTKQNKG